MNCKEIFSALKHTTLRQLQGVCGAIELLLMLLFIILLSVSIEVSTTFSESTPSISFIVIGIIGFFIEAFAFCVSIAYHKLDREKLAWKGYTIGLITMNICVFVVLLYYAVESKAILSQLSIDLDSKEKCESSESLSILLLVSSVDCTDCLSPLDSHNTIQEDILSSFSCNSICEDCREHLQESVQFSSILINFIFWSSAVLILILEFLIVALAYLKRREEVPLEISSVAVCPNID